MEPYGFIFDKDDRDPDQDVDLPEYRRFKSFAPIVSFYAAAPDRFTDIPWPASEHWEVSRERVASEMSDLSVSNLFYVLIDP